MLFLLLLIGDEHNDLNVSEPQRPYLPMNEGKHHNLNVHILCVIFLVVRWRGWSQDSPYGDNEDSLSHNGCCTDPFHSTFSSSMFNITLSFVSYVSIKPKLQHPPLATLQAFELLKIGYFKFLLPPLPQAKIAFKCPTQYQTILGVFNKCCGIKQSHGLVFVAAL